ncbi:MAG: M3 family oligoendopeptidase [Rhodospirillaceae bacterium]|nr:M3 family oligoendopeptidase [Rhodospirillaceae bacterium]
MTRHKTFVFSAPGEAGIAEDRATLADLPEWDLADLYPGRESAELEAGFDQAESAAKAFEARFEGKVGDIDGAAFGAAIIEYEAQEEILGRIMSYAFLVYAGNQSDPELAKFYQGAQERCTDISTRLIFFTLEINRMDEAALAEKMAVPAAAHYAPWVRDVRAFRDHQLSDEMEKILHEKMVAGRTAWVRLFDETMADLRFPFQSGTGEHESLTESEILHKLSDKDGAVRRQAGLSLGRVLGENIRQFALITNTLAKDKEIDDRWRRYAQPVSYRNLSNQVEDQVVEALRGAVTLAYPDLSHRYYALKSRWFGVEALDFWDRNAPLPQDDNRVIPWAEARKTVLDAYGDFSPELATIGQRFFDSPWIDVPPRPGKASGAFAHPTVPSAHPYLLLNYQGRVRDVMTLAHELGHGVHQVLAGPQGALMSDTPLTLAETASVFGEMLTFRALLKAEDDPARRRVMLAGKVEDMLNTVVRQISMFDFECRVHDERRSGELTAERLGDIWLETQTESLGPSIRLGDDYRHFWAYIPHFIHSPFYVYAYAFGDCLVNSLYAVYEGVPEGFAGRYLDMLRAGGTLRHKELLAPFGLDAADPAFWSKGLGVISGLISELESME